MNSGRTAIVLIVWSCGLLNGVTARATDISGEISTTLTITDDSQLTGDVNCTVQGSPCIAIGASGITLRLNGFNITGQATDTPPTNCFVPGHPSDDPYNVTGITVVGQTDVAIRGPGIVQEFQRWGMLLNGSANVVVTHVTGYRNCWSAVQMVGTSNSRFNEDLWVNNAVGSGGAPCGGICLVNSHQNVLRHSTFNGNGTAQSPSGNVDFGVGFEGDSGGNLVEENQMGGNVNGIFVVDSTAIGNVARGNTILGNPPGQVAASFPDANGADIHDRSLAGANTFNHNICLTYSGTASPAPCPNVRIRHRERHGDNKTTASH